MHDCHILSRNTVCGVCYVCCVVTTLWWRGRKYLHCGHILSRKAVCSVGDQHASLAHSTWTGKVKLQVRHSTQFRRGSVLFTYRGFLIIAPLLSSIFREHNIPPIFFPIFHMTLGVLFLRKAFKIFLKAPKNMFCCFFLPLLSICRFGRIFLRSLKF